jgi:hypothetical protein
MRRAFMLLLIVALMPAVLAINIDVEKISSDEVLIMGIDDPANFEINVTNNGALDFLSVYTFFGGGIKPVEGFVFERDESKIIQFELYPRNDIISKGTHNFPYFIQASDKSEEEIKSFIKIMELEDAIEVGANSINPESNSIKIFVRNKVNFNFTELDVKISSPFFTLQEVFPLGPKENKEFEVVLDKEDFNKLMAGFYTLYADIESQDAEAEIEGKIEFVKKDLLKTEENNYGLIISTKVISKMNEGNTVSESETIIKKNIFSRLFTTFSPNPDSSDRRGANIYYIWDQNINPGESKDIIVKTNWLIPFLLVILLVSTFYFAKKYSNQKLVIKKRVTFVKAKGGEFALKVTVIAEAKEFVERVRIIERLPPLVKMYERFAGELPDKVSKDKKRLEWDYAHLEAGERRVMSYIVYSKLGILGKFALPGTIARFEKEGKVKQTVSNKAYFLAEQKSKRAI